jgi:hypothetical protein
MRLRKAPAVIAATGVAILVWAGWSIVRANTLTKNFERINIGDSRDWVVKLLGRPRSIEKCGEPFGNPGGVPGCKEDYLYASPYAPLISEYWSVSFDNGGRVVDKFHYLSP